MRKISIFFICLAAACLIFLPRLSRAEEIKSSVNHVTVLPAKFDLSSTHGKTISQSLKIVNDSPDDYLYALSIDNISVTGENGEVGLGDSTSNLSNLFASWIETDQPSGKLEAKSTKIINFKISVPEITDPGGKYASIVISLDKMLRKEGESSAVAKVVSLVMLTVAGDYEDKANLISFDAFSKKDGSIEFISKIRNQGIAHVRPAGSIIVSNIFGQKISQINFSGDNILPGSTRRTVTEWRPDKTLFGIYHATLIANYGQKNDQVISGVVRFNQFPYWPTMSIVAIIVLIIFFAISKRIYQR